MPRLLEELCRLKLCELFQANVSIRSGRIAKLSLLNKTIRPVAIAS
jgi:hypothetical protein